MPKWCKWSFLLELLYLEQPSAAVAYSHFSPRWWHFHNGFFRWISSSSWTFWQKKAPIFEASIGGPDCFFLGVPSTNRYQPQSERWQRQAKDKEGTPLKKSLTLTRLVETTLPRQFHRLGDHGWGCFSNGPQLTRCVCRFANWILIAKKRQILVMTGDDWWWLLLVMTGAMKSSVGNGWCDKWSNPNLVDVHSLHADNRCCICNGWFTGFSESRDRFFDGGKRLVDGHGQQRFLPMESDERSPKIVRFACEILWLMGVDVFFV